jgi:hypothetical protein
MTPPLSHRPSPYECSDAKTVLKGAPQRSALAQAAMPVEAKGRGCRRMEKTSAISTDILGLTEAAKPMPSEQYPAH